ncbi:MAG: alpha/beta fold hydrolase [Syntrophobacterales bacterium]|jgi:alpha/beta superfamily hydrolase
MDEELIFFMVGAIKIKGLLQTLSGDKGVVISHPHPLYGGSMHNNVVESLVQAYQQAGYTTLRFNFRGVGGSQGEYDNGQGEQEDVKAAVHYLGERGKNAVDLAGYSFGAWVNALARPEKDTVQRMVMVSPPVAFLDFGSAEPLPQLQLVIAGSRDEIAPPELIKTILPNWSSSARLEIIEGADHFYGGHTGKLESILADYFASEES